MFDIRRYAEFTPKSISNLQGPQQSLSLGSIPIDNAVPYHPLALLSVITRVMNVRDHTSQAFVTSYGPFCDRSCQFVYRPQNVRSTKFGSTKGISRRFESKILTILQPFPVLFFEVMVVQAWSGDSAELLSTLVCQPTKTFRALFRMAFHVIRPSDRFCVRFFQPSNFSVAPAEIRDSNIFLCSSIVLSFDLHSR